MEKQFYGRVLRCTRKGVITQMCSSALVAMAREALDLSDDLSVPAWRRSLSLMDAGSLCETHGHVHTALALYERAYLLLVPEAEKGSQAAIRRTRAGLLTAARAMERVRSYKL
ncbi:MAG: hypothetical protein NC418_09570 [Muribaculaceae bacterium]|nr:hypothetical protein [Muribaculaceae bacterium]